MFTSAPPGLHSGQYLPGQIPSLTSELHFSEGLSPPLTGATPKGAPDPKPKPETLPAQTAAEKGQHSLPQCLGWPGSVT